MRYAPDAGLRLLLRDLTVLPVREMVAGLRPKDRAELVALFSRMRSDRGFLNDLRTTKAPVRLTDEVEQPALVIASRRDAAALPRAELIESRADSHLIWFGEDWPAIAERIRAFLMLGPSSAPGKP